MGKLLLPEAPSLPGQQCVYGKEQGVLLGDHPRQPRAKGKEEEMEAPLIPHYRIRAAVYQAAARPAPRLPAHTPP